MITEIENENENQESTIKKHKYFAKGNVDTTTLFQTGNNQLECTICLFFQESECQTQEQDNADDDENIQESEKMDQLSDCQMFVNVTASFQEPMLTFRERILKQKTLQQIATQFNQEWKEQNVNTDAESIGIESDLSDKTGQLKECVDAMIQIISSEFVKYQTMNNVTAYDFSRVCFLYKFFSFFFCYYLCFLCLCNLVS